MPKDAELTELFRSHHDAFEKLASMGAEDANTTSYLNLETLNEEPLTDGRQALSPARRSEYKQAHSRHQTRPGRLARLVQDNVLLLARG